MMPIQFEMVLAVTFYVKAHCDKRKIVISPNRQLETHVSVTRNHYPERFRYLAPTLQAGWCKSGATGASSKHPRAMKLGIHGLERTLIPTAVFFLLIRVKKIRPELS